MYSRKPETLPTVAEALPGRAMEMLVKNRHYVNGQPIKAPLPAGLAQAVFALGCFWGAERVFWRIDGVFSTAVGYAGGVTPNPTYEEVCSGRTGHTEVVLVHFDPCIVPYRRLLEVFWESHDPTQGMRQGHDRGTQYRSAIYTDGAGALQESLSSLQAFQTLLSSSGYGVITTEIKELEKFYYAEDYHQQYLAKNPAGYCGIGGLGLRCSLA